MMDDDIRPVADRMEGISVPAECRKLIGHEAAMERLTSAYRANKLHHAFLLAGPKGIGKSLLAFQFAKYIFSHKEAKDAPPVFDADSIPHTVHQQVAQGAHPELLYLSKPWDEKTKRFKSQLSVDEIRRTLPFYGMTAGAGGWRITIVDAADDMNASAANALLKVLEEPPKQSLFFVITHAAGGLLPTIRSRCQLLPLNPLNPQQVTQVIDGFSLQASDDDKTRIAHLSEGSVRRAIQLMQGAVLQEYVMFEKLMDNQATGAGGDWMAAHKIADSICRKGQEEAYALFLDLVTGWVGRQVRKNDGLAVSALAGWAEVWEKLHHSTTVANAFNLDKKQVILTLFGNLFEQFATINNRIRL